MPDQHQPAPASTTRSRVCISSRADVAADATNLPIANAHRRHSHVARRSQEHKLIIDKCHQSTSNSALCSAEQNFNPPPWSAP
jgi:hypothetical protein